MAMGYQLVVHREYFKYTPFARPPSLNFRAGLPINTLEAFEDIFILMKILGPGNIGRTAR